MPKPMLYLSPPDVRDADLAAIQRAFEGGWIAPLGPEVEAFERELGVAADRSAVAALSSGTAGLHLSLLVAGVEAGDVVVVSDLTFAASCNAIRYVGATPVLVDSDRATWNMDPGLLDEALGELRAQGAPVRAVIAVDLYGQCAAYERIEELCRRWEVVLIEDAAEALGASYRGRPAGSFGDMAVLSFNGNKIITTSGGGALLSDRPEWIERAVHLATQARDPAPHYQHSEVGYNYRLSNLLAALGRSQLADLPRRVEARRRHFAAYEAGLGGIPGLEFMPEPEHSVGNRWLTTFTIDPTVAGVDREAIRVHLSQHGIEARPLWKPMHLQPIYRELAVFGGDVGAELFADGLCLPSGSSMSEAERDRVIGLVRELCGVSRP